MSQPSLITGLNYVLPFASLRTDPHAVPAVIAAMDASIQSDIESDASMGGFLSLRFKRPIENLQQHGDKEILALADSFFEDRPGVREGGGFFSLTTSVGRDKALSHIAKLSRLSANYLQFQRDVLGKNNILMDMVFYQFDLKGHGPLVGQWHTHPDAETIFIARGFAPGVDKHLDPSHLTTLFAREPKDAAPNVRQMLQDMHKQPPRDEAAYAQWERVLREEGLLLQPKTNEVVMMRGQSLHRSADRPDAPPGTRIYSTLFTVGFGSLA